MLRLIYAIQVDKSVDVVLVIQNSILHGVNTMASGLHHPSLIIELCKNAWVVWTQDKEVLQLKRVIDNNLVYAIKDWNDDLTLGASFLDKRQHPPGPGH